MIYGIAKKIMPFSGILAIIVGGLIMLVKAAPTFKAIDITVSSVAIIISVLAGGMSAYIAHFAKSVSRHQRILISYGYNEKYKTQSLEKILLKKGMKVWLEEETFSRDLSRTALLEDVIENSNSIIAFMPEKISNELLYELQAAKKWDIPIFAIANSASIISDAIRKNKNIKILNEDFNEDEIVGAVLNK